MSVKRPPAMVRNRDPKSATAKTEATTKKPRPQKVSRPTSNFSTLSEDKVVDSDSEGSAPLPKPTPKEKEKKKTTKQKAPHRPPSPPPRAPFPGSNDAEEDSSFESSEESEQLVSKRPETLPIKVNGVKRKPEESSSEGELSETESEEELPVSKAKTGQDTAMNDTSSSSEEDSGDEDSGDSSSKPAPAKPSQTQPAAPKILQSIPAPPFVPPEGFTSVNVSDSTASSLLSQNSLAGKQVWLISAPSNVPLKSIREVPIQAVQDGSTVLQYKGIDYVLSEGKDRSIQFQSVLLPGQAGYQRVDVKVEKALKLQQKVQLPNLSRLQADTRTGSNAAADVTRAAISTIRPQPSGLKMRYKPPAFGLGNPDFASDSESDKQAVPGAIQFPKALGVHGAGDKQEQGPSKRNDKVKRKGEDVHMVNGSDMLTPSSTTQTEKKKKRKSRVDETPEKPELKESKEERRRRKKLKKEEKLKIQEG